MSKRLLRGFALLAALAIGVSSRSAVLTAAQSANWKAQLGGVEANGTRRIPTASVAAIAALKIGDTIGQKDVEAARQRLLASGLFKSAGFSFRNSGYSIVVTFALEDVVWKTPVVFDNFVDHTDAQLIAAVAKDVPSFDGVAPDSEPVLKKISSTLARLSRDAKDPGSVSYAMMTERPGEFRWRFRITRDAGPLVVCSVGFQGVPESGQPVLKDRSASLVGVDYSKDMIAKFAKETFVPLLPPPATIKQIDIRRAPATDTCARGVAVTVYAAPPAVP